MFYQNLYRIKNEEMKRIDGKFHFFTGIVFLLFLFSIYAGESKSHYLKLIKSVHLTEREKLIYNE